MSEARMITPSFLTVEMSCNRALQMAKQKLSTMGLRALQTFDLRSARLVQHDCPCPNHGTEDCDCQMVVLMVYGDSPEPTTLILHGNNGQTRFSIADSSSPHADGKLAGVIKQALGFKLPVST
jgi:hypothetical protein